MAQTADPYRALGVGRTATIDEIKAAHRALAKRFHPDASDADTRRFLAVQEAYQLLSDPLRRRDWDLRHAPGPVRAGEGVTRGAATRGRAGGRATDTGRARPAPRDGASTGPTTGRPTGSDADDDDTARSTGPWTASDRDPATRAYTWSAQGVPWWEDDLAREARRPPGSKRAQGPPRGQAAPPSSDASRAGGGRPHASTEGTRPDAPPADAAPADARERGGPRGTGPSSPGAGADAPPVGGPRAGNDFDVYSRSSGAAWSSASRAYFRRGDADLPRRGVFRTEGTTPVTGAAARRAADAETSRASGTPASDPAPAAGRTDGRASAPRPNAHGARTDGHADPAARDARGTGTARQPDRRGRDVPNAGAAPPPGPTTWTTAARPAAAAGPGGPGVRMGATTSAPGARGAWRLAGLDRVEPWPTIGERMLFATLAWIPLALVIGYGGAWVSGCDRAAASCPDAAPAVQTALLAASLGLFIVLPRAAYLAAWAAATVLLAGLVLAVPAAIVGNRFGVPAALVALGLGVLVAAYGAGALLAARDRPIQRPWTLPGRRRPDRARGVPR